MKRKQEDLIRYLYEHEEKLTSETLSKALSLSIRTIKSYIAELNLSYPGLILSSNRGYTIHKQKASVLLQYKDDIPQDYEGRCIYLIKKLLLEKQHQLDIFDLCDELFISYSTLKNDIYKMNTSFAHFQITFSCVDNKIDIRGTEKNKRRLITHVMSEEASGNFLDLSFLQESFPAYDIEEACILIKQVFHKYHYYINDFSFVNLLLHFAIIIDRVKEGNFVETRDRDFIIESENERALVEELCSRLEEALSISFNRNEQFEVYMLFKTNANYSLPSSEDSLKKLVGEDILALTREIIRKVNDSYYIDLNHENFITPFALHLKNLLLRVRNDTYTKNPMVDAIKSSCPTVYDIAIFIAMELMQRFHVDINEDEVTFLALHIGADIERQKTNDGKIQCILLCPDYMNMTASIYNKLLIDFGNQINIRKTISYEHELKQQHYDMLLTTIPLKCPVHREVCLIPPFPNPNSRMEIQNTIDRYRTNKKNYILKKKFHDFFLLLFVSGE